jgi:ribosomal protein S18 acetylase RimI-like enzyme
MLEMNTELAMAPAIDDAGYVWRPATRADVPAIHTLMLATGAAEGNPSTPSLEDLETQFDDPWSDAATSSRLILAPDGSVAALARVFANPQPVDEARAYLDDDVHPDHRAQLHDAVLDWLIQHGRERLRAIVAGTGFTGPQILRLGAPDTQTERIARYEQRGFRPLRYFFRMRRDLSQPIPDRPLPEGLTLTTFTPDLSEAVRQAHEESFLDHWGHEPVSPEDWEQFFVQNTAFRPDLTPVVLAGDQVAAYSINRLNPEENARQGYSTGWIQSLGTRRPWRKRGLASALLVWSMRAFQAEGLQFATLGVDAENPTGALGLYESLGFVSYVRFIAFGLPLDAAD